MEENFSQYMEQHKGRIHYQIHRLRIPREWYDEFYQEGMIGLWNAYKTYNQKKGEIGTYLNYRIRYYLLDLLRKKMRDKEKTTKAIEETTIQYDDGNRHRTTQTPLIKNIGILLVDETFWDEVKSNLTENQWKWVEYFIIAELSVKEIMEIEGVTADAVKGWGYQVRKKLKNKQIEERLIHLL